MQLVERLINLRMLIEATLDFPEEEIDLIKHTDAAQQLQQIRQMIDGLLARSRAGSMLRTGLHVVLTGLPNVGKSSLLNCLSGEERAIVTEHAGTTRDVLRETIQINGIPLHIVDTAGLRATDDPVERLGIDRAWQALENADVILQLVDARYGLSAEDEDIFSRLPPDVERIVVENKADLANQLPRRVDLLGTVHVYLSAKHGQGVELLREELLRISGCSGSQEDVILARARHVEALQHAAEKSALAERQLKHVELCAEELRLAQLALSSITGEFSADDLLGEIFSRFCIGK
jgi:tRNA modification GTPase